MPIVLDDIDLTTEGLAAAKSTTDAKFFSSKLTGNGKKTGLLNQALLPVNTVTNPAKAAKGHIDTKASHTQNEVTLTSIPFAPITRRAVTDGGASLTLAMPHVDDRFTIDAGSHATHDLYFDLTPQGAHLYEDKAGDTPKRDFIVQYRMELFVVKHGVTPEPERALSVGSNAPSRSMGHQVCLSWDSSPLDTALDFINTALRQGLGLRCHNSDALEEWLREYPIYERISRLAQMWDSQAIADELCVYIDALPTSPSQDQLNVLENQLQYLENYNVPLDAYRAISQKLVATFPEAISSELSKQNLNLLMNYTLDNLAHIKPQLYVPTPPPGPVQLPAQLSQQQRDAIISLDPLIMTQAGAGTGKSTVILKKINYLDACAVPLKDITVLSFTNAAADNITAKAPAVGSMTIARMINEIYKANYNHELSSVDTIINSIDIFYPNDKFAAAFREKLLRMDQGKTGAHTALNTFIERNFDQTIELLNAINQTSLELEIIICYQQIDVMVEPPEVACRVLIIDEVQDNSIFEFIYVLKYVAKHKLALFIVGDASQTLYEFRSANPRALNTLESSGVFTTFRLTTNYRSNQEILDFGNVLLDELETNQFAKIQLQANSLAAPTAASFQEKVTVRYEAMSHISKFVREELPTLMRNVVIPDYVEACLARGEQVAFLAYSRLEVMVMQEALERAYPNRTIANLVSEKVFATDIFSKYIKNYWNNVLQVQPHSASYVIVQDMIKNIPNLSQNGGNPAVEKAVKTMIQKWWIENGTTINNWVALAGQGSLSLSEFFDQLRDNLLSFEIRHNAVRQSLTNQKNRDRKAKNAETKADLVVSTIHGAKGLEFANVVVIHKEDAQMSQEKKRMYYVALTRAQNTEYILSYGSLKKPPIESKYQQILNVLTKREEEQALIDAGIDPDAAEALKGNSEDSSTTHAVSA